MNPEIQPEIQPDTNPQTPPQFSAPASLQPDQPPRGHKAQILIGSAALILLLLLGAALIAHNNNQAQQKPAATSTKTSQEVAAEAAREGFKYEATVTVTDSGFDPATLTVQKDTRVYFENKGTTTHSVVADDASRKTEPTLGYKEENHTTQPIVVGGGYAYSFHNNGTFHIHDGYHSTANVTIIVQ